jgi:hypothetical protein
MTVRPATDPAGDLAIRLVPLLAYLWLAGWLARLAFVWPAETINGDVPCVLWQKDGEQRE